MPPAPPADQTLDPDNNETPAWEPGQASAAGPQIPQRERYLLRGEIARGGLGRILDADDQELGRPVALKELLSDSPGNRARFIREIRLTARLQHPAIVPVYDAVTGPDGVLRYAMKRVTGTTLEQAIAAAPSFDDRLALLPHLLAVADAVAYAQDRGVIHRDIKPQNILIGAFGETLLIDWGVAKQLGENELGDTGLGDTGADDGEVGGSEDVALTRVGAIVGTPAYMAPEQARGEPADRRSDVYALGATLYHLLSGGPPYAAEAGFTLDALRAGRRPPPLAWRVPGVPQDLDSIVRRAMAEDPAARYPSAQELRHDLHRFSTGQLVAARRYSRGELVARWLRRHRVVVGVVVLALSMVAASGTVAATQVIAERDIAQQALGVAEARTHALTLAHAARSVDTDPTEAATWLAAYPPHGAEPDRLFQLTQEVLSRPVARARLPPPASDCDVPYFDGAGRAVFVAGTTAARLDVVTGAQTRGLALSHSRIGAALGEEEMLIATTSGSIYRVAPTGAPTELTRLPAAPASLVTNGVVALVGDREGGVTRINLGTGETDLVGSASLRINGLVLHGDAWSMIAADGTAWTAPIAGGAPRLRYRSPSILHKLAARADGTLIIADEAGKIVQVDPADHARPLLTLPRPVRLLGLGHGGRLLFVADAGGDARAIDLDTHQPGSLGLSPPWGQVLLLGLGVSPQDGVVAAVLEDGTLHAWRPATGDTQILRERNKFTGSLSFSPDGAMLATCAADGSLSVWPTPTLPGQVYRGHSGRIFHPTYLRDGRVATDSDDLTVRVWGRDGDVQVLRGHTDQVYGLDPSPDGRYLLSAANDGLAIRWDLQTGEGLPLRGHEGRIRRAIFTPDGHHMLTGGRDGTLRVWSIDGAPRGVVQAHEGGVHWFTLTGDGHTVWSVGRDRRLLRWDPLSGQLDVVATGLGQEGGRVLRVFALPGERALTCTDDTHLVIADVSGVSRTFTAPAAVVCPAIEVSPDGRLAAVPVGSSLSILDLEAGTWQKHAASPQEIHAVTWSPDSRLLALATLDGTARLLRVSEGASSILTRSESGFLGVRFSPDGAELAAGSLDHLLWVGPVDEAAMVPPDAEALLSRIMALTLLRLEDASGAVSADPPPASTPTP